MVRLTSCEYVILLDTNNNNWRGNGAGEDHRGEARQGGGEREAGVVEEEDVSTVYSYSNL